MLNTSSITPVGDQGLQQRLPPSGSILRHVVPTQPWNTKDPWNTLPHHSSDHLRVYMYVPKSHVHGVRCSRKTALAEDAPLADAGQDFFSNIWPPEAAHPTVLHAPPWAFSIIKTHTPLCKCAIM